MKVFIVINQQKHEISAIDFQNIIFLLNLGVLIYSKELSAFFMHIVERILNIRKTFGDNPEENTIVFFEESVHARLWIDECYTNRQWLNPRQIQLLKEIEEAFFPKDYSGDSSLNETTPQRPASLFEIEYLAERVEEEEE